MSPFTLIRKIVSPLLFLNIASKCKGGSALMKIKAAQAYVVGVKKMRIFFLCVLFVIFSFLLLGSGLLLIHMALFSYSEWSSQVKFIVALVLGGVEIIGAMIILYYLFKEETWAKFCGIQNVINSVVDGKLESKKERA